MIRPTELQVSVKEEKKQQTWLLLRKRYATAGMGVGKFKMEAEGEVEGEQAELLSMCQHFEQLCSFEKSRAAV